MTRKTPLAGGSRLHVLPGGRSDIHPKSRGPLGVDADLAADLLDRVRWTIKLVAMGRNRDALDQLRDVERKLS